MLPSLGQLSLGPAAMPAPTGDFYELPEPEAAELNANGGREPLTFEDYVPHRARGQEGATFRLYWDPKRVFKKPPGHRAAEELAAHGQSLYAVYDAKALWDWVKTHEKDPTNSFQISHEDWMELYAEYGNFGPIPEFVSKLPSLAWPDFGPGTVWTYEESGISRLDNMPWTGGAWKATVGNARRFETFANFTENSQRADFLPTDGLYMLGPPGEEYLKMVRHQGFIDFFRGEKGHKQVYKQHQPDGTTRFFATDEVPRVSRHRALPDKWTSDQVTGRLIRHTSADGLVTGHFKGVKDFERLDYVDYHRVIGGAERLHKREYYTGRKRLERVYKVERVSLENGRLYDTHYLRGARGNEKVYKRVGGDHENWVAYYETGEEHRTALRRIVHVRYQDEAGRSFLTGEIPDLLMVTSTWYYEGPRAAETFVRIETTIKGPDGTMGRMADERLEDYPAERRQLAQRIHNLERRTYSAWAPVVLLADENEQAAEEEALAALGDLE
jgi:hypothetical protein